MNLALTNPAVQFFFFFFLERLIFEIVSIWNCNYIVTSPVQFAGNIDVIHETLDAERQVGGVGAHQLLQLLTLLIESHQRSRLGSDVYLVLLPELFAEVRHQDVVKVLPAQLWIKGSGQDLTVEEDLCWKDGNLLSISTIKTLNLKKICGHFCNKENIWFHKQYWSASKLESERIKHQHKCVSAPSLVTAMETRQFRQRGSNDDLVSQSMFS